MTYTFNGVRTETSPGRTWRSDAPTIAFEKMIQIRKSQDWEGLKDFCELTMKEWPEWLTPYEFAGFANEKLGDRERAIELLNHVIKQSAGAVEYRWASQELEEMGTAR